MPVIQLSDAASLQRYVDGLLDAHELRGARLVELCRLVAVNDTAAPWLKDFQWLLFMPRFLNVALVAGACNSDCRMCSAGKGEPFEYLSRERLRTILDNVPTAGRITFSAGNSEPLMNPELADILLLTAERRIKVDFYTNGLALTRELADVIADTDTVNMVNFSLDAATPETYSRIRRRNLDRVKANIAYLVARKRAHGKSSPTISVSLVEMEDNIEELPELVDYAASIGAARVYVEALLNPGGENRSARKNPRWREAVLLAQRKAQAAKVSLQLPNKLRPSAREQAEKAPAESDRQTAETVAPAEDMGRAGCSWLRGVWIEMAGRMAACCINTEEDLGNIYDGKLWDNQRFLLAKMKLFTGRVFPSCLTRVHSCAYLSDAADRGTRIGDLAGTLSRTETASRRSHP